MFFVLGKDTWTEILTHRGAWEPMAAVAWCLWTAFATLAGLGILRPLCSCTSCMALPGDRPSGEATAAAAGTAPRG